MLPFIHRHEQCHNNVQTHDKGNVFSTKSMRSYLITHSPATSSKRDVLFFPFDAECTSIDPEWRQFGVRVHFHARPWVRVHAQFRTTKTLVCVCVWWGGDAAALWRWEGQEWDTHTHTRTHTHTIEMVSSMQLLYGYTPAIHKAFAAEEQVVSELSRCVRERWVTLSIGLLACFGIIEWIIIKSKE